MRSNRQSGADRVDTTRARRIHSSIRSTAECETIEPVESRSPFDEVYPEPFVPQGNSAKGSGQAPGLHDRCAFNLSALCYNSSKDPWASSVARWEDALDRDDVVHAEIGLHVVVGLTAARDPDCHAIGGHGGVGRGVDIDIIP